MTEIQAWVYNPLVGFFKGKATDPFIGHVFYCEKHETCELHKKGQCALAEFLLQRCPYGNRVHIKGPTKRSSKLNTWVNDFDTEHEKGVKAPPLKTPSSLSYVNDYVYIQYPTMIDKNYAKEYGVQSLKSFILKTDFTPKFIVEYIVKYVNKNMSWANTSNGGYLCDAFMRQLKTIDKELFEKTIEYDEEYMSRYRSLTNVGRKAVLNTLTPNVGHYTDIHKSTWVYDGEYLVSTNTRASFTLVETKQILEIKIKPTPNVVVKIECDEQVNDNTVFVD